MAALFARIRDRSPIRGGNNDLSTPTSPDNGSNLFSSLNSLPAGPLPTTQINGSISPPNSPNGQKSRNSSRSPSDGQRVRSNSTFGGLAPFPTPFHQFKLNPTSTKNQVNALKFIDRIDSLLFLGHAAATVFGALAACMANGEAQTWFSRTMNSDIHKPASLDDFRQCLINDHVWAFEQNRIMSRYQSRSAGNRRDPYLDSAEFKLHLAYIRDSVRLEEQLLQKDKKLAGAYTELDSLSEKESQLNQKISGLQYELANKESGLGQQLQGQRQGTPVTSAAAVINTRETDNLRDNIKQLEQTKSSLQDEIRMHKNNVTFLEQQKSALNHEINTLRSKVSDVEASNQRLRGLADAVPTMQARIGDLEARNARMQQHIDSTPSGQDVDLQRFREQNARFIQQLNQKDTLISELEQQVQSSTGTVQQHQRDAQQAQQQVQQHQLDAQQAQQQAQQHQLDAQQAQRDAQLAQQNHQQLQQQVQTLLTQNQQLQQQVQQAQSVAATPTESTRSNANPPYPYGPAVMEATKSMDDAFANMNLSQANLEAIIRQKDAAIAELHARIGQLTDEAINRVNRVFQIEQSLVDSHAMSRQKEFTMFSLERRLAGLGHSADCTCQNCSQYLKSATPAPMSAVASNNSAPMFKTPHHTNSAPIHSGILPSYSPVPGPHGHHNSIDLGVAASVYASSPHTSNHRASMMGPSPSQQSVSTNVSRAPTPLVIQQAAQLVAQQQQQVQSQGRRYLDIRFKCHDTRPTFIPEQSRMVLTQLLERGLTVLHPGGEFKSLWENITRSLLETLGGDLGLLGEFTKHLKLCFRDRSGSPTSLYSSTPTNAPKGLVVPEVWFGVWQEVTGLDIVCDF